MKSTDAADYQHTPAPVAGVPKQFVTGTYIAPHSHTRAQLTWAVAGVMTVSTAEASWIVPPQRAVWIPAGTEHAIRMSGEVAMRGLYIDAERAAAAGTRCKVIVMTGLLRELVLEMIEAPLDYPPDSREALIAALILEEIRRSDPQQLRLPMPRDPRLRIVCEALLKAPERTDSLDAWAEIAGASSLTLARLFLAETGMSFGDWRTQARLAAAVARISLGANVAAAARQVGYSSPSAFTAMFRRTLGLGPREYFSVSASQSAANRLDTLSASVTMG